MVRGEQIELALPETLNLGSYFLDVNLELGRGDKTALYCGDKAYSYVELWRLTGKIGNALRALGVEPENRVLLILEDSPEWVATWLAVMKLGAVGAHAYTYLNPPDYAELLDLVRPKVVVVDVTTLERVRTAAAGLTVPKALVVAGEILNGLRQREFSLQAMLGCTDERLEAEATHRDDIAFWNFSGGTTGRPKGVPHMHRDGVIAHASFSHVVGYSSDDIVVSVPRLFHHYARDIGLLYPLRSGAAVVVDRERATVARVFELVRNFRPTVLINVPTMMRAMVHASEHERADLSCLRRCMSSGEPLSAHLHREWVDSFGVEVVNRLGSAESGMGYLCNRPAAAVPGSSGTVAPLCEVKLTDEEGREVPSGQPGVLLVRCGAAGQGYVREHEKSKAIFLGNEWINTGDLFRKDENDYFWFLGRADELVKVSGIWVSPLEIERALQEYPGVKECVVLGIEDADGLTRLRAFVVLGDRAQTSAEIAEELQRFCKQRLAPHKFPRAIEFLDELPKTGPGKIDRRSLRGGAA